MKYNKESMATALQECLTENEIMLVYKKEDGSDRKKVKLAQAEALRIVTHLVTSMQKALLDGKQVYIPEIGFIEVVKMKAGRLVHNLKTKEWTKTVEEKKRIKARGSLEIITKLNSK